ncbi:hypothetical protein Slin15195_G080500 [Septoria linicola]|uniref:Uncharacterized protein n=1 Tax=Septoria linicola TaxID=215465 RepID=A0A9Q9B1P2_9PEZI|nr:hypothetical protein Slin14017_G041680 [Septoria linicola]USW54731.1 hypothetical protein Slin15195_G080500 [Septoria linicola]
MLDFGPSSRAAAVHAALNILAAQQGLFDLLEDAHYKSFMLSYYTADASLFLAALPFASMVSNAQLVNQVAQALQRASIRLAWMSPRNKMAAAALQVLEQYKNEWNGPQEFVSPPLIATSTTSSGFESSLNSATPSELDFLSSDALFDPSAFELASDLFLNAEDAFESVTSPEYTLEHYLFH